MLLAAAAILLAFQRFGNDVAHSHAGVKGGMGS
jgi:hypothetical protein